MWEQKESAAHLDRNRRYGPPLKWIFGVTDGGRFKCADYTDVNTQNEFVEGYTQQVEATNHLCPTSNVKLFLKPPTTLVHDMTGNRQAHPICINIS